VSYNRCWADVEHLLQAYVIATSTLVDISKVDVSKFDDTYFKSTEKVEKKKSEDGFFNTQTDEKKELSPEYVENQKKVKNLNCNPNIGILLDACFELTCHEFWSLPMNSGVLRLCAHKDGTILACM